MLGVAVPKVEHLGLRLNLLLIQQVRKDVVRANRRRQQPVHHQVSISDTEKREEKS